MNLQKEISRVMNLSGQELDDLLSHAKEHELLVKELMKEYKQFSDMMARKSRMTLLESNYDYLIFRAEFEMRKNFAAIQSMAMELGSVDQQSVKEAMERLEKLEASYGTKKDEFSR